MRMVCPACSAAYEVPDSLLTPGRAVRCARCGNQWAPVGEPAPPQPAAAPPSSPEPPPSAEPPPPPEPPPSPELSRVTQAPEAAVIEEAEAEPVEVAPPESPRFTAMDRLALHRANITENPLPLRLAWAASILALVLLIVAALVWRTELAHVWPASRRLFDALGLT